MTAREKAARTFAQIRTKNAGSDAKALQVEDRTVWLESHGYLRTPPLRPKAACYEFSTTLYF